MKKIATSSPFTWIMDDLDKGKFVRTYKRSGVHGYKRFVPVKKIYKLICDSKVRHPRLLKNWITYIDVEYIEGKPMLYEQDHNLMMNIACTTIFELRKINCEPIAKYATYKNNTGFLNANIDNLVMVLDELNNWKILERLGLRKDIIFSLRNSELDNDRKMSLIHGDLTGGNIIMKGTDYYIIDWELACIGDIAYELMMHFMAFEYEEDEKKLMTERLSQAFAINPSTLIRDINTYTRFEMIRRCFLKFNRVINLAKKGQAFDDMLIDAYHYYEIICGSLSLDNLRSELRGLYRG